MSDLHNKTSKHLQRQREAERLYNAYEIEKFRMPEDNTVRINPSALITRLSHSSKPLPDIK